MAKAKTGDIGSMNTEQIIDNASEVLHEDFTEPAIWSRSELLGYVDRGQFELARITLLLERIFIIRVFENKTIYELPVENIAPKYAAFNNDEILKINAYELDIIDTDWVNTTGTPSNFFQDNISLNDIGIYPKPTADGSEVLFTSSFGIVTYVEINSVLQTISSDYGLLTYLDYDQGETYFIPGGVSDPSHSNPYGIFNESEWTRGNLFLISKTSPDVIDTEDDKLTVNKGFDFIMRDYTLYQALFREGDGQDVGKASHFKERFLNFASLIKSYHNTEN